MIRYIEKYQTIPVRVLWRLMVSFFLFFIYALSLKIVFYIILIKHLQALDKSLLRLSLKIIDGRLDLFRV